MRISSSVVVAFLGLLASSLPAASAIPRKCQNMKGKGMMCKTPKKTPKKAPTTKPTRKPTGAPRTGTPTAFPTSPPTGKPTLFPTIKPTTGPMCPGVGPTLRYGGNLYQAVPGTYTWDAANAAARSYSCCGSVGNLASILSSAENDFIRLNLAGVESFIGFNDKASEGSFVWTSGDAAPYTNWGFNEPNDFGSNEDCSSMVGVGGTWNDVPCTAGYIRSAFIIKFDCNNPKTRAPMTSPG